MALPQVVLPTYELEVPSNGKKIKYRPFVVKEEKLLLLALESEDAKEIEKAVKTLLKSCISSRIKIGELPIFDLEYLFLQIRAVSIGDIVIMGGVVKKKNVEDKLLVVSHITKSYIRCQEFVLSPETFPPLQMKEFHDFTYRKTTNHFTLKKEAGFKYTLYFPPKGCNKSTKQDTKDNIKDEKMEKIKNQSHQAELNVLQQEKKTLLQSSAEKDKTIASLKQSVDNLAKEKKDLTEDSAKEADKSKETIAKLLKDKSRLQKQRVDLDIGEAKGAQQAAADYEMAMRDAQQGAVNNLAGALTTGVQAFSQNPFDVSAAAGTSGAAPSLGTFSGTDYSTFGQDLINFQSIMPNLTNDPFYQYTQAGLTAPKLPKRG